MDIGRTKMPSGSEPERRPRSYFALGTEAVAPAGEIEEILAGIWGEVLAIDGLGVEDDFWLVGGDSLVTVTLLGEIEHRLGLTLPLSIMLDCPTVRRLAGHLESLQESEPSPGLVPAAESPPTESPTASYECLSAVRAGGESTPVFVVHGIQGNAAFAFHLSKHLPREQSIYGFRALGLDGNHAPLKTIEAIAARYLESVRRVQPRGPYILAGFCAGGQIATEMAHLLVGAGEQVTHLFLIDNIARSGSQTVEQAIRIAGQRLETEPRLRQHLAGAPATVAALGEALKAYEPKAYFGRVHILVSQVAVARMRQSEPGWPKHLPPATSVRIVAATHADVIGQGMAVIGGYMGEQLGYAVQSAQPIGAGAAANG